MWCFDVDYCYCAALVVVVYVGFWFVVCVCGVLCGLFMVFLGVVCAFILRCCWLWLLVVVYCFVLGAVACCGFGDFVDFGVVWCWHAAPVGSFSCCCCYCGCCFVCLLRLVLFAWFRGWSVISVGSVVRVFSLLWFIGVLGSYLRLGWFS